MPGSGFLFSVQWRWLSYLGWLPILGVLPWACRERTVEVLGPMPSAEPSAQAGAPPLAPGIGGTHGEVLDSGLPVASLPPTCENGLGLGANCLSSADCCSVYCGPGKTGENHCQPTVGCSAVGAPCIRASDCCGLTCVATEGGRACGDAGYCSPIGEACSAHGDCCSALCSGGHCQALPPPGCLVAGELCVGNADCCGSVCTMGSDTRARCQLLTACRVEGEICAGNTDCCSGVCQTHPTGVMRCAVEKRCTQGDSKDCARQVGERCKNADECCSRACISLGDGSLRCATTAACRAICEDCSRDKDCCSGTCLLNATGQGRCASGACLNEGEICSVNDDCCQTSLSQICAEDLPGKKPKRCRRDPRPAECLIGGERCASSKLCCDGICVQDADFDYRCANYCAVDGARCSNGNDCCGPLSDCVSWQGERQCAAIGPL